MEMSISLSIVLPVSISVALAFKTQSESTGQHIFTMIASFILFLSLASAMSAPVTPKDEALRALTNPTPDMLKKLNPFSASLKATPSLAAAFPELAPESSLANQPADLAGGLNNIITRLVTIMLERLLSESASRPGPTNNAGTNIFGTAIGTGTGTGTVPQVPSAPNPNPFSAGSNPFSMFFPSMMYGNMMEGFMEMF